MVASEDREAAGEVRLGTPVLLHSGRPNEVRIAAGGRLRVVFHVDPAAADALDDRFVLVSGDGRYQQVRTVRDDRVPGDARTTVEFDGLLPDASYDLEWWRDAQHRVVVLQGRSYEQLMACSAEDTHARFEDGAPAVGDATAAERQS